jgi:hypothetical protein
MSLVKLKRDITTSNPPATDQVEIGELVLNATTGILYTKLTNGKIVKFVSSSVSSTESSVPLIAFGDVSSFCCTGDTLNISITNLIVGEEYTYQLTDLNNNGVNFIDGATGDILPTTSASRNISKLLTISGSQGVTLIKFSVKQSNVSVSENIVSICCGDCSTGN